ncbi:TetR/AcrR family transcriptional regulator [Thioclava sp. A2]|uniref:TetR/AcrR family transcriptional regulator n=1 Tax=Thioclava sp. FCG-A2 TaxID=3080562 RepID=UPI0029544454|nr:TetR/AcrR family transcriptional regulator [Thioclava sp. A2]MDV7269528.1 TetR/AcrR family transcriptional regulator [Thioclava sp. A2]
MAKRMSAENRKAKIISAVLALADEIGPDRLTTNDVAHRVGITQPAIFRHFPTKADLWLAVAADVSARLHAEWEAVAAAQPDPQARLRALVEAQFRVIHASPALPLILHSRELNVENPGLRDAVQGVMHAYQAHLVATLSALRDVGALRADLPVEDAAVLLISLVQGMAIRWSLGGRRVDLLPEGMRLFDQQLRLFAA